MRCFNGLVDLPLEKYIVRTGCGGGNWKHWLFEWKGVPLWYTAPFSAYGEGIWYAPDDARLLINWRFHGSNAKALLDRKRLRWWSSAYPIADEMVRGYGGDKVRRFKTATTEEALDRFVEELVRCKLQGGDDE